MTGNDICNRALVELSRDGATLLENGNTLLQELQSGLNVIIDDISVRHPFEFLTSEPPDDQPTIAGISNYDLVDGTIDVIDIVMDTGSTDTRKLVGLPLRRFRNKWAALQYLPQGKPNEWTQASRSHIVIAPIPDAVYVLHVTSTKRPLPITDFTQEVTSIPQEYHHTVLVFGVAMIGCGKVKDLTLLPIKLAQYEGGVKKMIDEDKRSIDVDYGQQPFKAEPPVYQENYWATPFILRVE